MLIQLILAFFRIGLFAIGGGLATLPFLYQLSYQTNWFSVADISNMIAVSQSTPGPIGINMASYVGFMTLGIPGVIVATFSLIAPSLIICIAISRTLDIVKNSPLVQSIFSSLRPASAALIFVAGINLALTTYWDKIPRTISQGFHYFQWQMLALSLLLLIILKTRKPHPILLILLSALCGIIFKL